jgi:hypothetical protein
VLKWWSLRRLIGVLLVVSAASLGVAWTVGRLKMGRGTVAPTSALPGEISLPTCDSARDSLSGYFAAVSDEDKIHGLYDQGRVGGLWRHYYHERGKPFPQLEEILSVTLAEQRGRTVALCEVWLAPGGRQPVAMIWEGDHFLLDWESQVAYGSMDWIEWLETRPSAPQLMRVYLSRAPSGPLTAEGPAVVVEHRDSLGPELARITPGLTIELDFSERQRVPVTGEFAFRKEGGVDRLYLIRLIHEGWSR